MTLTNAKMSIYAGVPRRSRQVLVLLVRDVDVSPRVTVLLGQAKVDDVHEITLPTEAHEEVVGLDVPVDEVFAVNVLDATDELVGEEQHGLERELAGAEVEEILEARAEQFHDHDVVVALGATPLDQRDPDAALHHLVEL